MEKIIKCDTEKATQKIKFTQIHLIEYLGLEVSYEHLAEALLQLREGGGPERRWTTTVDVNGIVGPDPVVVGKSKPRLHWVLLFFFTGPTSNEDAVRDLLPIVGLIR